MDVHPLIDNTKWIRTGTTLTPTNAGDDVTTTGRGTFGDLTVDTTLTFSSGLIEDSGGTISFGSTNLTTIGTVTAEQLTSTDDITMQGHLFTLGNAGAAVDTVISFLGSTNSSSITFDEGSDIFNFGSSDLETTGIIRLFGTTPDIAFGDAGVSDTLSITGRGTVTNLFTFTNVGTSNTFTLTLTAASVSWATAGAISFTSSGQNITFAAPTVGKKIAFNTPLVDISTNLDVGGEIHATGEIHIDSDDTRMFFGATNDASIAYSDGLGLIISDSTTSTIYMAGTIVNATDGGGFYSGVGLDIQMWSDGLNGHFTAHNGSIVFETDADAVLFGTNNLSTSGNIYIKADNKKLFLGASDDASIYYDNADLIINPREVGTGNLKVSADTDISAIIGRAHIGFIGDADDFGFSHIDHASLTNYAFRQTNAGLTVLNAATGQGIFFRINNAVDATQSVYNATGLGIGTISPDTKLQVVGDAKIGDDDTNYTLFETDGTIEFHGAATVFKDINIGASTLSGPPGQQPGIVNFVDEIGADTGIATFGLAVGEALSGLFEMQHDYKEGSDIIFHVHWQGIAAPAGGTDNVQFQITYTVAKTDETLDAVTVITVETAIDVQYDSKNTIFAAVTGTNFKIEDQVLFTLERIAASADEYAGEALLQTIGIHYEIDTVGSRQILTK